MAFVNIFPSFIHPLTFFETVFPIQNVLIASLSVSFRNPSLEKVINPPPTAEQNNYNDNSFLSMKTRTVHTTTKNTHYVYIYNTIKNQTFRFYRINLHG